MEETKMNCKYLIGEYNKPIFRHFPLSASFINKCQLQIVVHFISKYISASKD